MIFSKKPEILSLNNKLLHRYNVSNELNEIISIFPGRSLSLKTVR